MLPAVESPHKKAKMEGRQKADFSESKFVKFYKAGANQTGNMQDSEAGYTATTHQSPPHETQIKTTNDSANENSHYEQKLNQNGQRLNFTTNLDAASRFTTNLDGENKENLTTEITGRIQFTYTFAFVILASHLDDYKYLTPGLCVLPRGDALVAIN